MVACGSAIRIDSWSRRRALPLSRGVFQVLPALMCCPSPSAGPVSGIYCLDLFTGELLRTQCHPHELLRVCCLLYNLLRVPQCYCTHLCNKCVHSCTTFSVLEYSVRVTCRWLKGKGIVEPVNTLKEYEGSRVRNPLILNLGSRCGRVFSSTQRPLYPLVKNHRYLLNRGLGGFQTRFERLDTRYVSCLCRT